MSKGGTWYAWVFHHFHDNHMAMGIILKTCKLHCKIWYSEFLGYGEGVLLQACVDI